MITGTKFNEYIPQAIAVFVLGFIVTASRELPPSCELFQKN